MSMKIYVRRRHIEKGKRRDPRGCPIALACKDALGGCPRVGLILLSTEDKTYTLPYIVTQFTDRFDSGKPVKPFAFVLK